MRTRTDAMQTPELPGWQDFRDPNPGEDKVDYLLAVQKHDRAQSRRRDHWLADNVSAVYTQQDLFRRDLLGDGTLLRPGVLRQILRRQRQLPDEVRKVLREEKLEAGEREYSAFKKGGWAVLGGTVTTVIGGLIVLAITIVTHHA